MTPGALPFAQPPLSPQSSGLFLRPALPDIIAERIQQVDRHGFTLEHDLGHAPSDLAAAAASYLETACDQLEGRDWPPTEHPETWPWEREAWKPGDVRTNLLKAAAIIWALIDRIDGPVPPDCDVAPDATA